MALNFTERQANAVVVAVTILATLIIILAFGSLLWLIAVFLRTFSSVFLPLAVGAVIALVFRPYYMWLNEEVRLPAPIALAIVFLSILLPVGAFFWFFGALMLAQLSDLTAKFPEWWNNFADFVRDRWPKVVEFMETNPLGQRIRGVLMSHQEVLFKSFQTAGETAFSVGAVFLHGIGTVLSWVVLPVYFGFFLTRETRKVDTESLLPFLKPETRSDVVYLIKEFVNIIVAFFRGQLIIAFLQGVLFAVGFSLAGLRYGFVIGLGLGFLNIIPYLGSIVGLSIALPVAYFQEGGGWDTLLWVLGVFAVVQLIEGYVLTPKIMGNRTGLHFMAIIVAVFFWGVALGGILGMILAIPLTAFLVSFWHLAKEKYIRELV
jgi:predicted PurR-regulated permease PerM